MKRLIIPILMIIFATTVIAQGIDSNTVLLLHADGDESTSEHTYTAYGNPTLSSSGKFDGAMDFDGTGDYLSIPDSSDWDFGSDNFTIDFWARHSDHSGREVYISQYEDDSNAWFLEHDEASGGLHFGMYSSGYIVSTNYAGEITDTDWHHIALVKNGNDYEVYKDGISVASTTDTSMDSYTGPLIIGSHGQPTFYFGGDIDELRVSKGIVRWTTGFTPDTSPHSVDANTNLLLHFEGDESDSNHNITFNGDADVSASDYKFDGSYHFDGTGDYLSIPDNNDFDFGNDNFTIDLWIYPTASLTQQGIIGHSLNNGVGGGFLFYLQSMEPRLLISDGSGWTYTVTSGVTISTNEWTHLAIIRNGDKVNITINGLMKTGITLPENHDISDSNEDLYISRFASDNNLFLTGYIDEFRISRGIARWTNTFTPDTVPYSVSSATEPTYTEFSGDGDTTDFSSVDVSAVVDPVLANSNAKVEWKGTLDLDGADLDSAVQFNSNFVRVDSAALAALNAVANITLKGTSYDSVDTYYILKDGAACGDCIKYSANPVKFEVSGFSNYTTGGNLTGIPEFSTMTLGIGLIAVLVGLVLIRRKT